MVKTHFISTADTKTFQDSINDFIKDKNIIDIKYQSFPCTLTRNIYGQPTKETIVDRALIIYMEDDDGEV